MFDVWPWFFWDVALATFRDSMSVPSSRVKLCKMNDISRGIEVFCRMLFS
jgi:hypothetical protein